MHRCCCRSGCKKDFGKQWSAFGGGGCTFNEVRAADSCQAGTVVTYQVLPRLQIGGGESSSIKPRMVRLSVSTACFCRVPRCGNIRVKPTKSDFARRANRFRKSEDHSRL
jgi:hypothetical protein